MKRSICTWIAAVTLLLLGGVAQASSPYEVAIENTWDFDLSGSVRGVAYLTFNPDKTVYGYLIVAGYKPAAGTTVSEGSFIVIGDWTVDSKGVVTGNFANPPESDIPMDITGFTGKIDKKGRKFKLTALTPFGKVNFKGVPAVELPSLVDLPFANPWTIILQKYPEEYSYTYPSVTATEMYPNTYFFFGESTRRCVVGYAALSKGNQFAVATGDWEKDANEDTCDFDNLDEIDKDVSATTGKLNVKTGVAKKMVGMLQGVQAEGEKEPRDKMILILGE